MKTKLTGITLTASLILVLACSCSNRTPSRKNIPLLKKQLYRLQEAVKAQNRAAIDSLLSPQILEKHQSSDSLLRFVYGPDNDFAFQQFGNADIAYTSNKARIDAFIMDSTHAFSRPIALYMAEQGKSWLFTGFGPGKPANDTASVDTNQVK